MLFGQDRAHATAKGEQHILELTDLADRLGIAERVTSLLAAIWNVFHPGGAPRLMRYAEPEPDPVEPYRWRKDSQARRPNLERIASAQGQAMLQAVLRGEISQRQAARNLDVHPNSLGDAVRRLREITEPSSHSQTC